MSAERFVSSLILLILASVFVVLASIGGMSVESQNTVLLLIVIFLVAAGTRRV